MLPPEASSAPAPPLSRRTRKRKLVSIIATLLLVGLLLLILGLAATDLWITRSTAARVYSAVEDLSAHEFALVLGTSPQVANGRTNLFFSYRMDAAADIFQKGKVRQLILSGAVGSGGYDEPEAMRQALLKRGLPDGALLLDRAGSRTLDSVVRAKKVFGIREMIIVSQQFHDERALFIADRHGITAIAYAAEDVSRLGGMKVKLREVLARAKAVIDLYLLDKQPADLSPVE